jgi:electron transfer flavoprotein beta subunit
VAIPVSARAGRASKSVHGRIQKGEVALNIIVCVKRVPQTAEADVRVDSSGKDIEKERLTFDINEYDAYALEEAVLFREKYQGAVTAITVGPPDSQEVLRIALAKGADQAIRIKAEDFGDLDALKTAQLLKAAIKGMQADIIFCGAIATDDAYSQVGMILAQLLEMPHATLVTRIEAAQGKADIHRELEGGLLEHLEMSLPAVIAVQSGINVPRYASLIAIRKAAKKEIEAIGATELAGAELQVNGEIESLFVPPVTKKAEILSGDPAEVSDRLAGIIKEKGLI